MVNILQNNPPPSKPGVYLFRNADEGIIYIGKAKNLHHRVRSYFRARKPDLKTGLLTAEIAKAEYIITDNEVEALILENILIKKHKPKYNIKLRDDKNYQYIVLDYSGEIARCYTTRRRKNASKKDIKYFGPYTSGSQVRNTMKLIKTAFPYCTAKSGSPRSRGGKLITGNPCFNYHLHRCPGVCVGEINPEKYKQMFFNIELFLKGQTDEVKKRLKKEMEQASDEQKYEKAARVRSQLQTLQHVTEQQKIIAGHSDNHDYISVYRQNGLAAINLFLVREGKLVGRESMLLQSQTEESDTDVISAFASMYYTETNNIPKVIFSQYEIDEKELLARMIESRANHKIKIQVPKRGVKRELILLGEENARSWLSSQILKSTKEKIKAKEGLLSLQKVLGTKKVPKRIESFDISNISGQYATGSMIVFKEGKPDKSQYRKFRIKIEGKPDDYAMMAEMLKRRLKHPEWAWADLWIIDGGKGQLNVALDVLHMSDLRDRSDMKIIALAKNPASRHIGRERVFTPGRDQPILLPNDSPALQLIQRIRDEAHRFAITYHRKLRSKGLLDEK